MPFGCLCLIEISAPFVSTTYIMNLVWCMYICVCTCMDNRTTVISIGGEILHKLMNQLMNGHFHVINFDTIVKATH